MKSDGDFGTPSGPELRGLGAIAAGSAIVRVMGPVAAKPRSRPSRGLSDDEWAKADRVATRLHAELHRVVAGLPEHARGASGMARHVGVLRATCQRVVAAIQEPAPSPAVLGRLPGAEGLRQFLEGLRRSGASETDVAAAESAVEQFARLIDELGGSQTRLAERVAMSGTAPQEREALGGVTSREDLFESAVRITGRRCEVALSIYIFRPAPGDPASLERALGKAMIGHGSLPGAMPMVLSSGDTLASEEDAVRLLNDRSPKGRTPEAILRPFTTQPLPTVTSRGTKGKLLQVIDPEALAEGQTVDVVTALRGSHPMFDPASGKATLDAVWSLVNCPSRRLVLDVYLHRDMERDYRPSLDCQIWNPGLDLGDDRWVTRVPGHPRLELLGPGLEQAACESYPRHAELTRYLFERVGWHAGEFEGFRCEVPYPVWRAGYCMVFEHVKGR